MTIKDERLKEILKDLGAKFLEYEGNKTSLLTVTDCQLSKDKKHATILFTVFPDSFESTALQFAKHKRSHFKDFIRKNSSINFIPMLDFEIDNGEKNRQNIDRLLNVDK